MRRNTRRRLDEPGLQYELSSTPSPLQASPADSTKPLATAELTVIASNPNRGPVHVASVSIAFDVAPPGDENDATYLTSVSTGIVFEVMGDPGQATWTVTNDGTGTFTVTARAGSVPIASQGLAFLLRNIRPNRNAGTFDLTISETLLGGGANEITLQDSKFPFQFTLDNFHADESSVAQGAGTTLRWNGGVGATLTIFHPGGSADVTGTNSWPTGNLTRDTEFVLQASVGTVAFVTWSLTVEVADQILELTSLTVTQATRLKGPTTIGAETAPASLDIRGDVGVSGAFTAKTAEILDHLAVRGLNVDKWLAASSAAINVLTQGEVVGGPGTFLAHTDGFLVGNVLPPPNVNSPCICLMKLSNEDGVFAYATGGSHAFKISIGGGVVGMAGNANSATLPVRAFSHCYLSIARAGINDLGGDPPTAIWWVPLGAAISGETLTKISDAVPEAHRALTP